MAIITFNGNPSDRDLRQFAAIWLQLLSLVIGAFIYSASGSMVAAGVVVGVSAIAGAIGYARPAFMRPIFLMWMAAAYPIGWTISHVLLAAIYYLIVTPIGLVMRLVRYDPMQRRFDRTAHSYWVSIEPVANAQSYFRQF